jgi:21S rRNA (GM2251-2'-O)-methyltransferase
MPLAHPPTPLTPFISSNPHPSPPILTFSPPPSHPLTSPSHQLDPGNLGAILRTAHFLSVDALALSSRHSAPLTPTALKASAGASESLPLLSLPHPGAFVDASKAAGWKFYAAVAPPSLASLSSDSPFDSSGDPRGGGGGSKSRRPDNTGSKSKANEDGRLTSTLPPPPHFALAALAADPPVLQHPTVLMLGSEGEGLRWNLQKKADATVSIEGGWRLHADQAVDGRVDSLNVSVAAGLLVEGFLRAPHGDGGPAKGVGDETEPDAREGTGQGDVGARVDGGGEEKKEGEEEGEKELF